MTSVTPAGWIIITTKGLTMGHQIAINQYVKRFGAYRHANRDAWIIHSNYPLYDKQRLERQSTVVIPSIEITYEQPPADETWQTGMTLDDIIRTGWDE